jgi:hypothetical protein
MRDSAYHATFAQWHEAGFGHLLRAR